MIAIDTNLVVRLLMNDDPAQVAIVASILNDTDVTIPASVVLEVVWVLRSAYGATDAQIRAGLHKLVCIPKVVMVAPEQGAAFLRLWEGGLSAEDAAHLAFAGDVERFVTFDRDLVKRAKKLDSTVAAELAR